MNGNTSQYQYPPYRGRANMGYAQLRTAQRASATAARGTELNSQGHSVGARRSLGTRRGMTQLVNHAPSAVLQSNQRMWGDGNAPHANDNHMRASRSDSLGSCYHTGSQYGSFLLGNPSNPRRHGSGVISRDNSFFGRLSAREVGYGTLYRTRSNSGPPRGSFYSSQYGSFGSLGGANRGSFTKRSDSQDSLNSNHIGSTYWRPGGPALPLGGAGSLYGFHCRASSADMANVPSTAHGVYGREGPGSRQGSFTSALNNSMTMEIAEHGLGRMNSLQLSHLNSCMNGFYNYGANVAATQQTVHGRGALSQGRLAGRPTAPPNWVCGPRSVPFNANPMSAVQPQRALDEHLRGDVDKDVHGQLMRCNSEKKVGFYFKDVRPAEGDQYKRGGAESGQKVKTSTGITSKTNVHTVVLLERQTRDCIYVDGTTVSILKPNTNEMQKFGFNEVAYYDANDPSVYIDSLEELCDTFLLGCNISLVMADAQCPTPWPAQWYSWNILRKLMRDVFARMPNRSELRLSVSLLDDDKVMDLLAPNPQFSNFVISYSPLFGNVPYGMTFEVLDSASEFNGLLKAALSRAVGQSSGEFGIILVMAILRQVRKTSSHPDGEEDVVLSSLFATGVGDGIAHYGRILDKNPAEPRAMFQFAVGGPSQTAAIISIADDPTNSPKNHQFMTILQRLGKVENYSLRLGSIRRFISYTKESLPKTRQHLENLREGPEKESLRRSVARYETMLADAEAMLESPDRATPKTYVRS